MSIQLQQYKFRTPLEIYLKLKQRTVWKISNVNTPTKGIRIRDNFSLPLTYNDFRFTFLSRIVDWLEHWKNIPAKFGKLSPQIFASFRHTTVCLLKIVNYLTNSCGFDYVLSSFLQNDSLEHHFGLYRMLSGAQYQVTACQAYESERHLNISSILKLFSKQSSFNSTSLKGFIDTFSSTFKEDELNINLDTFLPILEQHTEEPPLYYPLSGVYWRIYSSFFISKKKYPDCLIFLTKDKVIEFVDYESAYTLIEIIDRGSLKWPSRPVIDVISELWNIYTSIESDQALFDKLLAEPSRSILVRLALLLLKPNMKNCGELSVRVVKPSGGTFLRSLSLQPAIVISLIPLRT